MKFAGFALLAAGLAFVFHAYSPSKFDTAATLNVHEVEPVAEPEAVKLTRNFSIDTKVVLKSVAERAEAKVERIALDLLPAASLPQAVALPVAVPVIDSSVSPVQTAGDDSSSRSSMIQRIKRELRRVGCYDGRIDSDWDRPSRAAMSTFMERVNASLPSEQPDVVLLNLVRNHRAMACGATCPMGQALDGDGKCLPNAIIAKLKRKSAPTVAQATPAVKPFTTTVTINEVKPTAATLPLPRAPVQIATKAPPRAPLPGRMAMGGPVSASVARPEKSWWDNLVDGSSPPSIPASEQTLDRPVGLTQVPQPRLVRRVNLPTGAPRPIAGNQVVASNGLGANGSGDGTALTAGELTAATPLVPAAKPKAYRKSAKSKPGRQRDARSWSSRNVQAMFQHPLGRL